jgi:hypothetical protein
VVVCPGNRENVEILVCKSQLNIKPISTVNKHSPKKPGVVVDVLIFVHKNIFLQLFFEYAEARTFSRDPY